MGLAKGFVYPGKQVAKMASEDDIRSFIQQQREAGAFDSSGQFSLDLRQARAKSERIHQDLEGAHLLYWLLAMSFYKSVSVNLTLSSVRATGNLALSWHECERAARGVSGLTPSEKMLQRAITACAALATSPAQLTFSHESEGHFTMDLSSGEVRSGRSLGFTQVGVEFPRQVSPNQRAAEYRQIESRCGFNALMPRYENRELTAENLDGYCARPPCTTLWNTYTHPGYLLALRQCEKRMDRTGFLVADESEFKSWIPQGKSNHSVFFLRRDLMCRQGRADRVIGIPLGLEGPGFIRLVFRGIVMESFAYDLGVPGAWVVACVDHLATDLSGLKLVREDRFHSLLSELRSQTLGLAREALDQLDQFALPEVPAPEKPGLMVRLMLWAFAPREETSPETPRAQTEYCRQEVKRRLLQCQELP